MQPADTAPLSPSAADDLKRQQLRRMQWIATGMFFVVTAIYAAATVLDTTHPAWSYVAAFAEAAMVGAIADWFAVTALFRHPLGMRFIPHTAIIPRNKARIADNLGAFVQGEFFAHERIAAMVQSLDPASRLATWLAVPANASVLADTVRQALLLALKALDDRAVRQFLDRNLSNLFRELDLSALSGKVLQALTHEGRHQAILDQLLKSLNQFISQPEIKESLVDQLATKVPLYFDKIKASTARYLLERALDSVRELLIAVDENPEHPLRIRFDASIASFATRLEDDPELKATIRQYQEQMAANPALRRYVESLWTDFKAWIERDLAAEQSRLHGRVTAVLVHAGATLSADAAMRNWINTQLMARVPGVLDRLRPRIGALISDKVKEWKDEEVVDKVELNIGKDLQYIRINGTLVGGLVGLIIHAVTVWLR